MFVDLVVAAPLRCAVFGHDGIPHTVVSPGHLFFVIVTGQFLNAFRLQALPRVLGGLGRGK